ncbi:disease resistance protein RGA5-like [Triticum dicoccoides]|uniref:disease resistance protein RGA5-like n=1 Tax=Triticum dicoccoides TaxID=85692 RepID=UPI00189008AC|nr:disease resistance protein RGA5-like [Triticum dicoccoides]XP_044361878.1 disease resistance protein RGA5-like [Triticum aestivum]
MYALAEAVMGSVIRELGNLLHGEYKLFKETKDYIMFLKAELESMHVFLKKMSDTEEEPDEQTKCWVGEVRELSYDIEDNVYDFLLHSEHESNNTPQHGFRGFIDKCVNLLSHFSSKFSFGHHHETIYEFQGLKRRVVEASERRTRYKLDDAILKPNNTAIDLRLLALYAEKTALVGIEGPKGELIQLMMDQKSVSAGQLKVLSIVGFGGLGKTTLANQIYHQLETQFESRAFTSVSQKPNIRKILRHILSQVGYVARKDTNMEMWDEDELIRTVQQFLKNKRYFIVIDNIWDEITWNIVRCALPETMKVLPEKIRGLQQLETLELGASARVPLPPDVVHLRRLLHLTTPFGTRFPDGIGNLTKIRRLGHFDLSGNSIDNIRDLGGLTDLRDLRIDYSKCKRAADVSNIHMDALSYALDKLCSSKYSSCCLLQRLRMWCMLPRVPNSIGELRNLHHLELKVIEVLEDDIGILAQLHSLIHLELHIFGTPKRAIMFGTGFPVLSCFRITCIKISFLTFEAGALSKLQRLEINFNAHGWEDQQGTPPIGIEQLPGLKKVIVRIGCYQAKESDRKAAQYALGNAIDMHAGDRTANIVKCKDILYCFEDFGWEDIKNSRLPMLLTSELEGQMPVCMYTATVNEPKNNNVTPHCLSIG